MIIVMEESKKSLKIWYQSKILDPPAAKKEVKRFDNKGDSRGRGREDDKLTPILDFNPYADEGSIT
jgi:hypothetical protein